MRKAPTYQCEIMCSQCGNIYTIQKSPSRKKEIGSVKSTWCYRCKKETINFIIIDKTLAYNYLNKKIELNEKEKFLLNMLNDHYTKETNKVLKKWLLSELFEFHFINHFFI